MCLQAQGYGGAPHQPTDTGAWEGRPSRKHGRAVCTQLGHAQKWARELTDRVAHTSTFMCSPPRAPVCTRHTPAGKPVCQQMQKDGAFRGRRGHLAQLQAECLVVSGETRLGGTMVTVRGRPRLGDAAWSPHHPEPVSAPQVWGQTLNEGPGIPVWDRGTRGKPPCRACGLHQAQGATFSDGISPKSSCPPVWAPLSLSA